MVITAAHLRMFATPVQARLGQPLVATLHPTGGEVVSRVRFDVAVSELRQIVKWCSNRKPYLLATLTPEALAAVLGDAEP